MGIDRKLLQSFEWYAPALGLMLALAGVVNLMSAASTDTDPISPIALRQLAWLGLGLLGMIVVILPDYRRFDRAVPMIYILGTIALIAVLVVGPIIKGAQRWVIFGPIRIQPSEMFKLVVVITFARLLARRQTTGYLAIHEFVLPALLLAAPIFLVLQQPDLGTTLLIVLCAGTYATVVPIQPRVIAILGAVGLVGAGLAWFFYLHDYQKERIFVFLDPSRDPLGTAYHAIQSQIAIGSGGFAGKGWLNGSQTQLDFLPEQQTDFVFSVVGEEWGFRGAAFVMVMYLLLMIRGLVIARQAKDLFGAYLAIGVVGMFFWAATINMGMVLGIFPVVGVPLPLFSYGGSSLFTCMIGVGLLMNVSMRRFAF